MLRRRKRARSLADIADTGWPHTVTSPEVGASSVPAIVNSVLLPEPLGPMIATSSPASIAKSTSTSACTIDSPSPYDLLTRSIRNRALIAVLLPCAAPDAAPGRTSAAGAAWAAA